MRAANILHLGVKELRSLARDPMMLVLIVYAFTLSDLRRGDGDAGDAQQGADRHRRRGSVSAVGAHLERLLSAAFPHAGDDHPGRDGCADGRRDSTPSRSIFRPDFQRDVLAGRTPDDPAQRRCDPHEPGVHRQRLHPDHRHRRGDGIRRSATAPRPLPPVDLAVRVRFNPTLNKSWFGAVMEVINKVTMLSIVLTGAALIREREHGTIEHLLVMPVTPLEIMAEQGLGDGAGGARRLRLFAGRSSCRDCSGCRSRARSRCSWLARRCICSPPPRWASSWARSRARCRSSACC